MNGVLKIGLHKRSTAGARSKTGVVDLLQTRLANAFPVLRGRNLVQFIDPHVTMSTGRQARVDAAGIKCLLCSALNIRIADERLFRDALQGTLIGEKPEAVVFRFIPSPITKFDAAKERADKLAATKQILTASAELTDSTIESRTNWLSKNLPDAYFITCTAEEIACHVKNLGSQSLVRLSEAGKETFISPSAVGQLGSILEGFKAGGISVKRARIHTSTKGDLSIFIFDTSAQKKIDLADSRAQEKIRELKLSLVGKVSIAVNGKLVPATQKSVDAFISALSLEYFLDSPLNRICHHFELFMKVRNHDKETIVEVETSPADKTSRITLVGTNIPQVGFLLRLVRILEQNKLQLKRVFVETMENETTTRAIQELGITGQEPIRALVGALKKGDTREAARQAILSWGDATTIEKLIDDTQSLELKKSREATEALVAIGTQTKEETAINTFYITKADGKPLDEIHDAPVIQRLKEDFTSAKWYFGEEFAIVGELMLRNRQANLLHAAASFARELTNYGLERGEKGFSLDEVRNVFLRNPDLTRILVDRFEAQFDPYIGKIRYIRMDKVIADLNADFDRGILQALEADKSLTQSDLEIIRTAWAFVSCIKQTNYFRPQSNSLAFSLDPNVLRMVSGLERQFPDIPYAIYYIVGSGFSGYHNRFDDIARGGIRLVPAGSADDYRAGVIGAYDEVYSLSSTQNYKNIKGGIPEGGSKGILHVQPDANPLAAFRGYVNGLHDLIAGTDTLLFLGPDENTGSYMDFGAQLVADRGYPYPRTFTTGKSEGGVPHDVHGITTAGLYEYEKLVMGDLDLDPNKVTKVQTGGPDGDLGSNEIRVTKGPQLAIIDASGAAYDPLGLDHNELLRIADARVPIANFDRTKLGAGGFVIAKGGDGRLPNGDQVQGDDLISKDRRHLLFEPFIEADMFVPAGGRPHTVDMSNVHKMLKADGTPKFRIIIEGANVFITQEARLFLEEKGVIIIKDSSANKGGVMSSSFEVLAAFILSPEEFQSIYDQHVEEVKERIRQSARQEYALLQRLKANPAIGSLVRASDLIGKEMKTIFKRFMDIELPDAPVIDDLVALHMLKAMASFGKDRIRRIPPNYKKAVVAAYLASNIVYRDGLGYLSTNPEITPATILEEAQRFTQKKSLS